MSGYFFGYLYLPRLSDEDARGWAFIQRIDEGSFTLLCDDNEGVDINFLGENTIRAVSEGSSHTFYLNGKLICSTDDATYERGPVAVLTGFSDSYTTTGGKFFVNSVSIKSMDEADALVAAPPRAGQAGLVVHAVPAAAPGNVFVAGVN